ncbi:carboxylesterase/lipase family protein [Microbacterium sp. 22242]|uniref:carboxylesterase/lipase family protein n=1 Tax=Microbacterium sp. 22242 TaxID=3453896 RepID=UPI003F8318ED
MRSSLTRLLPAMAAAASLTLALSGYASSAPANNQSGGPNRDAPAVTIAQGKLTGLNTATTTDYFGIPYAAPPIGDLRWRAPEQAKPWEGTLDATKPGPDCPQGTNGDSDGSLSENCLYLNVYTPAKPDAKQLPVVVFLHGGGHVYGTPNIYDGHRFAATGSSVVVIPAFRVGLFGFFGTPGTASEGQFGAQGNWGMLDQQQALKWVQQNISKFGGDAKNVTIVGESAGGNSVCFQLASPTARALFHKAVVESSGCDIPTGPSTASDFAAKWGCAPADMSCLRHVDPATIVQATTGFQIAHPVAGGPDEPVPPLDAAHAGALADVPVMIGANRDEWLGFESGSYPLSPADYEKKVTDQYGAAEAAQLQQMYPADLGDDPSMSLGWLVGDQLIACPAFDSAQVLTNAGADVHFYEFADETAPGWRSLGDPFPPSTRPLGATHTTELQYLFNYQAAQRSLNSDQTALADEMVTRWTSFATNGNPTAKKTAAWETFDGTGVLELKTRKAGGSAMISTFEKSHHCDYWNSK